MSFSLLRNVSKVSQSRSQHGQKQLHGSKPHSFLPPTSPGSEGGCLVDLAVYTQPAGIVAPAQVPLRPRGERQVRLGQEELPGEGRTPAGVSPTSSVCLPRVWSGCVLLKGVARGSESPTPWSPPLGFNGAEVAQGHMRSYCRTRQRTSVTRVSS